MFQGFFYNLLYRSQILPILSSSSVYSLIPNFSCSISFSSLIISIILFLSNIFNSFLILPNIFHYTFYLVTNFIWTYFYQILWQFLWSQWLWKALEKTFWSMLIVTVVPWTSSHILYGLPLHQRAMLARLLANKGLAIYVVYLNRYFVIPPWYYLVVTFLWH